MIQPTLAVNSRQSASTPWLTPPPFLLKTFKGPFRMVDFWFFPSPLYFWTWCLAFMYSVNLYNLARLLSFDLGNTEEYYCPFGPYIIYTTSFHTCYVQCSACCVRRIVINRVFPSREMGTERLSKPGPLAAETWDQPRT